MPEPLGTSMDCSIQGSLRKTLDETSKQFSRGEIVPALESLGPRLSEYRNQAEHADCLDHFIATCRSHSLYKLLLQDPYTRRASEKPRGYAGDAVMMDYVYTGAVPIGTSEIGTQVFRCTTQLPNGQSVIWRRNYLASQIDETASRINGPVIASIACGHLREFQQSQAMMSAEIDAIYAVDQDPLTLNVVTTEQSEYGVIPLAGSVSDLLSRKLTLPLCHLIYSAGLYDYLPESTAAKLTNVLFQNLAPGGRLLIANFLPDSHGRGYMEGFMDWHLVYRTKEELVSLASPIPTEECSLDYFQDPWGNVGYLELRKQAQTGLEGRSAHSSEGSSVNGAS